MILFIYGWNQYLWPLLITTRDDMQTIVIGIKKMIVTADALTEWKVVMATAMLAMLPPVAVVILMQRCSCRAWWRRRSERVATPALVIPGRAGAAGSPSEMSVRGAALELAGYRRCAAIPA